MNPNKLRNVTLSLTTVTIFILTAAWITTFAQPNVRQSPLDTVTRCNPNEYVQITGDGLVCVPTTNTTAPTCSPEIDCCTESEFVKITGQGLQCFSLQNKETTCTYPGEENCCGAYEFGFITNNELICAAAPIWDAINQFLVPEKTNFQLNLKDKVIGNPTPSITTGTLPNWIISQNEILGGRAPAVSGDRTFSFSASAENIAGDAQTNVFVVVQNRACGNKSDCERFIDYSHCHNIKRECVQCLEDNQCPGSARCVDNTCECADCPITAPHCGNSTGHVCVECENDTHCPAGRVCADNSCVSCNESTPNFTVSAGTDTLTIQWDAKERYTYQIQYGLNDSCDGSWQTVSGNLTTFTNLNPNTMYYICMRHKAPKCSGYSDPGVTTGNTGGCSTSCESGCSGWSPRTSANCSGSEFAQTRACNNVCDNISCEITRNAQGTASCGPKTCTTNNDCEAGELCSCGVCTKTCNNDNNCLSSELCSNNDQRCADQSANQQTSLCIPKPPTNLCQGCDEGWQPNPLEVCQGVQFTQQYYTNCTNLKNGDRCNEISRTNTGTKVCRKIPGVCDNSTRNKCAQGTPNDDAAPDTEFLWKWYCKGYNGGIAVTCQKNKPVHGRCNNSVRNGCTRGVLNDSDPDPYYWHCNGLYGGNNSEKCSKIGRWAPSGSWGECSGGTQSKYVNFACQDGICTSPQPDNQIYRRTCKYTYSSRLVGTESVREEEPCTCDNCCDEEGATVPCAGSTGRWKTVTRNIYESGYRWVYGALERIR